MLEFWIGVYVTILVFGLVGVGIALIALDVHGYTSHGWKQYTLTDNEWDRLCLHLQTQKKMNGGRSGEN